jgi:hypothetical protein
MIGVLLFVVGSLLLFGVWRRGRRRRDTASAMLVSREDRTALFARRPGRLRGSGLL